MTCTDMVEKLFCKNDPHTLYSGYVFGLPPSQFLHTFFQMVFTWNIHTINASNYKKLQCMHFEIIENLKKCLSSTSLKIDLFLKMYDTNGVQNSFTISKKNLLYCQLYKEKDAHELWK